MPEAQPRETQPFKLYFGTALVEDLARRIQAVHPLFPASAFVAQVSPQLDAHELKGRIAVIAAGIHANLPPSYSQALHILLQILGPPLNEAEGMFNDGWYLMPLATFVEHYGLAHLDESLAAMHAITQRHTAEFAIRPFLERYPEQTLAMLGQWAHDESAHVRRLVSEGTRPRLPWAMRLPQFIVDPAPVLALLETLKDDPSAYVRKSVANNLNDIAKDHPDLVVATLARWNTDASPQRQWIIRHALRSLVKQGHAEALRLLGAETPLVTLAALEATPAHLLIGAELTLAITLESTAATAQTLVVDYVVQMPAADGKQRRKVFKLRTQALEAGQTLRLNKRHSFAPVTVRRYYPGRYRIEVQVNGQILGGVDIELLANEP